MLESKEFKHTINQMKTVNISDKLINKYYPPANRHLVRHKGWTVSYDETKRGFNPIRETLLEAILVGITECMVGMNLLGLPYDPTCSLEIPSVAGERGGFVDLRFDSEHKTVEILGYISGGTLEQNQKNLSIL